MVKNRFLYLQALRDGWNSCQCYTVPRPQSSHDTSAWPYSHDASALSASQQDWNSLSVMFSANSAISGSLILDIAAEFWKGQETMAGHVLKLGFLFLYGLFTGTIVAKVCSQDNSFTLATIFLQLISDRHSRALMPSILHLMSQNPSIAKTMPKVMPSVNFRNLIIYLSFTVARPEAISN